MEYRPGARPLLQSAARTAPVGCTVAAGQATLTCSDAAAVISYTLDGSAPLGTNSAAQLYSAPFAVTSGQLLQAAARTPGKLLSNTINLTIP